MTHQSYRIVCVTRDHHVEEVGTGAEAAQCERLWKATEVFAEIIDGNQFYTVSPSTGGTAAVEPFRCSCGAMTLRSDPSEVSDNNIADLPPCAKLS